MKTIGLIGGMSWESTIEYYKIINNEINKRLGNLHSAKMLIESYNFDEIEKLQSTENWGILTDILINSAQKLEKMGADYIAITTNTMHLMATEVQDSINIPLIHIAQACGSYIIKNNMNTVVLFGTKYTMTKSFYKDKLNNEFGINVIIPSKIEQETINNIIYEELCKGIILDTSRNKLIDIISNCKSLGAQAVILGCTELPNIIKNSPIPVINTTEIHCLEIVDRILK